AKVAGTERGVSEPQATFSACFGAPFMPLHPSVYGNLLRKRIAESGAKCWLVNTGWSGGPYGVGSRMSLRTTRRLLSAALAGELDDVPVRHAPVFGHDVPLEVDGVEAVVLDPRRTWEDREAFDEQVVRVAALFLKNFEPFEPYVDQAVLDAAPKPGNVHLHEEPVVYR
ncbi:MAG: phosphoenolpyruvate carboxykinase (ATP), partial [Pseudomonadota bacterium]